MHIVNEHLVYSKYVINIVLIITILNWQHFLFYSYSHSVTTTITVFSTIKMLKHVM